MRSLRLPLLLVLALVWVVPTGPATAVAPAARARPAVAAPTVDVVGSQGAEVYVGTGGVVFPSSHWRGTETSRHSAASCVGCQWKVTQLCDVVYLVGMACPPMQLDCPPDTQRVRVWLQRPGQPWEVVGEACVGGSPPPTLAQVGTSVREQAIVALPPLRPGVQPSDGGLVGIPAVFWAGQPAGGIRDASLSVVGLDVRLDSRVRWGWTFGDGVTVWTSRPGARYPDTAVTHVYRRPGTMAITVRSRWRASYRVEGMGPFPVPGPPLTQDAALGLVVREARAVLVE